MGNGDLILPSLDLFYIYLGFEDNQRVKNPSKPLLNSPKSGRIQRGRNFFYFLGIQRGRNFDLMNFYVLFNFQVYLYYYYYFNFQVQSLTKECKLVHSFIYYNFLFFPPYNQTSVRDIYYHSLLIFRTFKSIRMSIYSTFQSLLSHCLHTFKGNKIRPAKSDIGSSLACVNLGLG